jgi:primosomal protein N' (replication factor Y) (superfamily II helicase)
MSDSGSNETVLQVALDVPLRRLFDYLAPPETAGTIPRGARVRVPFGRRHPIGVVMGTAAGSELPRERLKVAEAVPDPAPVLDETLLELLVWAADYYHHPIGQAVAAALPHALREGRPALEGVELWCATDAGRAALAAGALSRAPQQRALLTLLSERGPGSPATLALQQPRWREAARTLARRGYLAVTVHAPAVESGAARGRTGGPPLRAEQALAVEQIGARLGRFAACVLQGITGSGKTEVYLRLAAQVLERGQRVLVLVPEIGLTPQLVARFGDRFEAELAVLHSGLAAGERLAAWRAAFSGRAHIVLGTRSAIFAPVPALGLIVVDEEHDPSFKQHEGGFRYSARDLAVVRAQRGNVPVVLGSATPALETLQNVVTQRYTRIALRERALQAQPPRLALVDLRAHPAHAGLSLPVTEAIGRHLRAAGQVLVFLNRRGYAPTLLCTGCGWIAPCRDCDARLTVHRAAQRLACHHCGAELPLPARCPQCGFPVKPVGQGTERIEATLAELYPGTDIVRLDRDVVRHGQELESAMGRISSGAARILVGTQMVTKGHDFPDMTLAVVLNADQGLFSADFRAPERLAQTIVQVAGRAGRGARAGEVLIQTEYPEHPLLKGLLAHGYEGFAASALGEREQAAWPPFSRLAAVRDSAATAQEALGFLQAARRLAGQPAQVRLLGPVPAAMARRAARYHAQLLVESAERGALHEFLAGWIPRLEELPSARRVHWALDVDPIELY